MVQQGKHRHSIYVILVIFLLFLIPLTLALILYLEKITLGKNTTNHGKLIVPPFSITKFDLYNSKGQLLKNQIAKKTIQQAVPNNRRTDGKWLMLFLYSNPCEQECQQGLYKMRQIRLATGKNRDRVARAILTYRGKSLDRKLTRLLSTEYKGTRHLIVSKNQFERIVNDNAHVPNANKQGTLYLVDPLGNIMMLYKPNAKAKGIFKDIQKLLKVSQIG